MTARAWGEPLRDARWAALPAATRLLSELRRWNRLGGEPFHRIYWYAARCLEWAVIPLRLPGLKVLASMPCDDTRDRSIAALLPLASAVFIREVDTFANAMVMVGMPPDFAGFDEEPSLQALHLPPLLRKLAGNLTMTSSFAVLPQGPSVACVGMHPVPPDSVAAWIAGRGREITEETGFVFWYPCYPGGSEEAAFLTHNIAYWRFFDSLPVLCQPYAWNGTGVANLQVDSHHPTANSIDEYRRAYVECAPLRNTFAQAVALLHSDPKQASAQLDGWAEATKARFPSGRRFTVCLQTWSECPTISGVGVPPEGLVTEIKGYVANCPVEATAPPFITVAVS